ncbi:MAG: preprotein translocase subunit SecG [Bacilli bacterium]|jgi:preprotein translocase subunit SecG|nr:preprotein translocase subunit SecG [Bacilli bacterium]MDD3389401.1 preprotein translocase subunit SecG [Bacilli bacterium]MDD4344846.1 preprotein translocase subunit SecG [Bacilli bacterium]MDD4520768.1 preprotein translocase subunit SecG [Bacilli bacterium]MDY0399458.1 preprotein translocase subunit SecG [Bacilli bacterium]
MQALDIIFLIVAIILIIITILQGGKSEGASGAITGGGLNVFVKTKERGVDKVMSYITFGLATVFFLLAILSNVL